MARIEGIRIRNFRSLKYVTLGRVLTRRGPEPLTPMAAVIEKNGVGESTLFDAFGFLADCLKNGVEEAFDIRGRGGFERLRSQGESGPIQFEVSYKEDGSSRPITYELSIGQDGTGRPTVKRERLRQRREGHRHARSLAFCSCTYRLGSAIKTARSRFPLAGLGVAAIVRFSVDH